MSAENLTIGEVFAGRYRVLRRIAAGGMGAVYEVEHLGTASHRALKVMHAHMVQSEELRDRFQRESKIAAQIKSKYIVDVSDAGIDEKTGMPFLVMELLQGEELGRRLRSKGRLGFEEAVTYLWQTALALDKTHRAHIVHRDLKPDNLFVCDDEDGPPKIKVLDFGIAKFVAEGGTQANATRSVGTPLYMAPEQFRHGSSVSPATDIYSLGMVAYTIIVGASYWAEEQAKDGNIYSFVGLAIHGPQESARARARRRGVPLPESFDAWFVQATARDPENRFPSATAAISALARAVGVSDPAANRAHTTSPTGISSKDLITGPTPATPITPLPDMFVSSPGPVPPVPTPVAIPNNDANAARSNPSVPEAPKTASSGLSSSQPRTTQGGSSEATGNLGITQSRHRAGPRLLGALIGVSVVALVVAALFIMKKPTPASQDIPGQTQEIKIVPTSVDTGTMPAPIASVEGPEPPPTMAPTAAESSVGEAPKNAALPIAPTTTTTTTTTITTTSTPGAGPKSSSAITGTRINAPPDKKTPKPTPTTAATPTGFMH